MRRDEEFSEFFTSRFDWARRTAYAMCGDWSEAEELAQNAFVKAYAKWPSIRRDTAVAYVRTIVTRLFLDSRRRRREDPVADLPEHGVGGRFDDPDARLHAALRQVPPKQRAALVLRFVHDLSIEQTAAELGCSIGNVKSQTARGLATLREAYGEPVTSECA
ncbi:SigE family RNA polymerase sigma factor [Lentzea flava]|uniref:RNA polymerase sigma24 factor n=1 Tax=Lentzea flava TaxID=103732 RepID=A0ABQ2UF87_9PSEU|nr:SigE family RNA polymerase sigma factor [Lentzea flava]MCP2197683.1 RNA polymerase sigma-70 factor, sigma-E family [Lentzea flava]GGU21453.1 RNA polymerase sigma24 factor [Lentzea flava]